jgi:protease I
MKGKKILMLVGDFVEDYEVIVPFQALTMLGYTVHAVCPGKVKGETVRTAMRDFDGGGRFGERTGHHFTLNATFALVKLDEYDALIIPGGRAPERLRLNARVIGVVQHFAACDKPIAAICDGVQLLAEADVIAGRDCTGPAPCEREVRLAGGRWIDVSLDDAVVDANLITAPGWPAQPAWLAQLLGLLAADLTQDIALAGV